MRKRDAAKECCGERDTAKKQRANQIGSDKYGTAWESVNPDARDLADQCGCDQVDCGEKCRLCREICRPMIARRGVPRA